MGVYKVASKALLATLGFDERHVIKSLIDIGMSGVKTIVLLVPDWGLDDRTVKAIDTIWNIAGLTGIPRDNIIVREVTVLDPWKGVRDVMNTLYEIYLTGVDEIIVSLGGGLRALVIETYTATLLVNPEIARKITVRVGVEGKSDYISFRIEEIPICLRISEQEKTVLKTIAEGVNSLSEIARKTGLPRSTTWKTLQKLYEKKIVEKKNRQYYLTRLGETILKLYP